MICSLSYIMIALNCKKVGRFSFAQKAERRTDHGLLGAADGAFILQKKKRTDPTTTTMQIVGRDQQD